MFLQLPTNALNTLGESTAGVGEATIQTIANNPGILVTGIILIAAAILIFYFVKKIIVNSILGFIGWILLVVFMGVSGPLLLPTLAVSLIFGIGGVGALMVLMFFGII